MSVEERLIQMYMVVCEHFPVLRLMIEHYSNHHQPFFSDEEVLTIYLFGIIEQRLSVKLLHKYVREHWTGVVCRLAEERGAQSSFGCSATAAARGFWKSVSDWKTGSAN